MKESGKKLKKLFESQTPNPFHALCADRTERCLEKRKPPVSLPERETGEKFMDSL